MDACNPPRAGSVRIPFPKYTTEALERVQAALPDNNLESIYIYDLIDQQTLWSSNPIAARLGYDADDAKIIGPLGLANLIHPDDINGVSDHYQRFGTLRSGEVITITYRMRQANGEWCYLCSQETPLITAISGFPLQILGILQTVTHKICTNVEKLQLSQANTEYFQLVE